MWWPTSSLLLLPVTLVINQANTAITEYFNILDTGGCADDDLFALDDFAVDCTTLGNLFQDALNAAKTSTDASGEEGRDGYVARKLFTTYFGIIFEDADTSKTQQPTDATKDHWTAIDGVISLFNSFMANGALIGPGTARPYLDCQGYPTIQKVGWGAQVNVPDPSNPLGFRGAEVGGKPITVDQVFDVIPNKDAFFIPEKVYYQAFSTAIDFDVCGPKSDGSINLAMNLQGRYEHTRIIGGEEIKYEATEAGVIMCPMTFQGEPLRLGDVKGEDPATRPQMASVIADGPVTLFHEIIHLVTSWTGLKVIDITYDMEEILLLAEGKYTVTLPDGEEYTYDSYHSTQNAETYAFFAFSWWYYKQQWVFTIDGQDVFAAPATFYDGYLVYWNQ